MIQPTEKQYAYAEALASRLGYNHLHQAMRDWFGKNPIQGFGAGDYSRFIDWARRKVAEGDDR